MRIEEIKEMIKEYRKEMRKNKIPCGKIADVKIAPKNAQYFAITELTINGYIIKVSAKAIFAGKKSLKNTLLHELCHTCIGCMNHGEKFKKYGKIVFNVFGEEITTYSTKEEQEITKEYKTWMKDILFMI